jgi:hypothetical protein
MSILTGGSTAIMCPASHEGILVKRYFIAKFSNVECSGMVSIIQGRALILAGSSLPTSHPAGRCPHHCPAFGTGELQEGGTTL